MATPYQKFNFAYSMKKRTNISLALSTIESSTSTFFPFGTIYLFILFILSLLFKLSLMNSGHEPRNINVQIIEI